MSIEQNKSVTDRIPVEFNQGNVNILDEIVASNAVDHSLPPNVPPTVEGTKTFINGLMAAFPDLKYELENSIAEGDYVFQQLKATGTMKGELNGIPPTNKSATWTEMHVVRFDQGKIIEHWAVVDQVSMMQQLGLLPMPAA